MKDLTYYRRLPYRRDVEVVVEDNGVSYFVARIRELPWIEIDADSREEALMRLQETFEDAIRTLLEEGDDIAEPELWPSSLGPIDVGAAPPRLKPNTRVVPHIRDTPKDAFPVFFMPESDQIPETVGV